MKLTLACLFLGMVVASPIANISPNGDTRVQNIKGNSYMTPSDTMISNGPAEVLPNGTRHHPWHHKGKHEYGHAQHGQHPGHSEPCHEHQSPPFAPPPHSPPHGHHGPPPHWHGHHGSPRQIKSYPWADDTPGAWEDEAGWHTQDEADDWFMGWEDEAEE